MDAPVRVGTVQFAVFGYHLRLHPEAELHAQRVNPFHQRLQATGQTAPVLIPVPQRAAVIVPMTEPAVVQHHQLHTDRGSFFGKLYQLFFIKIEVCRFPVVDQHRPPDIPELSPADPFVDKAVHPVAQSSKSGM